jgi:hypothetical protein
MPGLVPGIHADPRTGIPSMMRKPRRVDGRDKPGHDDLWLISDEHFPFLVAPHFPGQPCDVGEGVGRDGAGRGAGDGEIFFPRQFPLQDRKPTEIWNFSYL